MNFHINDFRIVHGDSIEEIELQVKILLEEGYCLQGTIVAQPNPGFLDRPFEQEPYHYYQMLARKRSVGK